MLHLRDDVRTDRGSPALAWAAWLFVFAGGAALAWSAVQVAGAHVSQRAALHALAVSPPRIEGAPGFNVPTYRPSDVERGAPIAALSIPRLNLSVVVLHGSDAGTLRRGLGHIEHTAMPGERGNVGIAGHRDSFFRPLRHVRTGDEVWLDTPVERVRYLVTSLRVVDASDVGVLNATPDATLTLVTCYPFGLLGAAPDRFVVRARRATSEAANTTPVPPAFDPARSELEGVGSQLVDPARGYSDRWPVARSPRRETELAGVDVSDESMGRQAIERFRQTYNATLAGRSSSLVLEPCDVTVAEHEATATCQSAAAAPDGIEPSMWTFGLVRTTGDWRVKSVTRR